MRLSESDFWELTLAQYMALVDRYHEEQEWLNFRAGIVKKEEPKPQVLTPEQQIAQMIAATAGHGMPLKMD